MLREILGKYVVSFIDDILVHPPSLSVHVTHVHQVLEADGTSSLREGGNVSVSTDLSGVFHQPRRSTDGVGLGKCGETMANTQDYQSALTFFGYCEFLPQVNLRFQLCGHASSLRWRKEANCAFNGQVLHRYHAAPA